jgi:acyl-CoA synthetase (AMP-forming)/AMP-acid ligase II
LLAVCWPRSFEEKFGWVIPEGYGLSETSPVASFNLPERPRKPGSIGVPVEGVQMRLVDDLGQPSPRAGKPEATEMRTSRSPAGAPQHPPSPPGSESCSTRGHTLAAALRILDLETTRPPSAR